MGPVGAARRVGTEAHAAAHPRARASRDSSVDRSQGRDTPPDARCTGSGRRSILAHVLVACLVDPVTGAKGGGRTGDAIGRQQAAIVGGSALAVPGRTPWG